MISILMPVFNTADYLHECLDSILKQSETNWELLAINDFSTDNSKQILEHYAAQDTRIQVFDNTEKGIIPALRLAYDKSSGEYITRMDSDDMMSHDKLFELKKLLETSGEGSLSTGAVKYFSADILGEGYKRYEQWLNDLREQRYPEIYKECVIPSPCWMAHRTTVDQCGAFKSNRYPEDYDLCFRFYHQQVTVKYSPKTLHYWRDRPTRVSRTGKNYADNAFLELKLYYFLKIETVSDRPLILWGAGKKGKTLAKLLIKYQQEFIWVTNNPRKQVIPIYDKKLQPIEAISTLSQPQIIIAIANASEQQQVSYYLNEKGLQERKNYTFFC